MENQNKRLFSKDLLKEGAGVEKRILNEEESDSLHGNGMKIITPSNIIDIYSKSDI